MKLRAIAASALAACVLACSRSPSPLTPGKTGSIGLPGNGAIGGATELPKSGVGFAFLRDNDRHFTLPRFGAAVLRAAAEVEAERPGGTLVLGDFSKRHGGFLLPHLSHRNGRDADLVFYAKTLDGASVKAPEFIHYGADGLAWDPVGKRFYRFDVDREWLLVRALLEDPDARIQWMFVSNVAKSQLLAWARAKGEPAELLWKADEVMLEPHPGGIHDDHIHIRTACKKDEIASGCEASGPERPWLAEAGEAIAWNHAPTFDSLVPELDPLDPPIVAP